MFAFVVLRLILLKGTSLLLKLRLLRVENVSYTNLLSQELLTCLRLVDRQQQLQLTIQGRSLVSALGRLKNPNRLSGKQALHVLSAPGTQLTASVTEIRSPQW